MKSAIALFSFVAVHAAAAEQSLTPAEIEFFENKIRPVLAENCYQCHNSVDKKKGDIALDYKAALLEADIIVPGKPEESTLIGAIRHAEDFEPMPSKSPKLANIIIKSFEDWVRMGAPDPRLKKPTKEELQNEVDWDSVREQRKQWWSYQPIKKTSPPAADNTEWDRSAIDRFVYAGLKANGLAPQSVASPHTLVRRLHLILTGLPPKPEVVDAFVADPSEAAYEKLVDELMASKDYGERWARFWMDWFRYAESYGSEGDPDVPYATQYRDYLIRAINADVPYDQLIREHLAGDLLEKPRVNSEKGLNESAIGLAHLRMVPHGFGVTDAYGEQVTFTDNQVDVVSKAILGTTVSCARCHNHKFDPISQADFYKLYGIMISSRPAILNVDSPELQELHWDELRKLKNEVRQGMSALWIGEVDAAVGKLEVAKLDKLPESDPLAAWANLKGLGADAFVKELAAMRTRSAETAEHNEKVKANATFYADLRDQATYDKWFRSGNGLGAKVSPAGSFAIAPEGGKIFTGIYPAGVYSHLLSDKHSAVLSSVFHQAKGGRNSIRAMGNSAVARFTMRSYPLMHGGLHPAPGLKPESSWVNLNKYKYWNGEKGYYQINTASDSTFRNGGPERSWFGVFEVYAGDDAMRETSASIVKPRRIGAPITNAEELLDAYKLSLHQAVVGWMDGAMSDDRALLLNAFMSRGFLTDELEKLPKIIKTRIEKYRQLEGAIRRPERSVGVVDAQPWDQPMLERGDYKKEGDPVPRGFLEAFPGEPYQSGSGRRELAEDMLAERNTLTPRVIVNRLWHHTFGRGLVASTDNFGRLGKPPSHPELLDHLAANLRDNGWSMKRTVKQLVMSRTFRSASSAPAGSAEKDPANLYLAYFTPRRLDAEAVLDTIRFVAHNEIGQRAIYTRAKRNRLDPFLKTFNYPIPTTTVGVRDLTNVPAQALTLMNGNITRESARSLGQRIKGHPGYQSDSQRVQALFKQAYARDASSEELAACLKFLSGKSEDPTAELAAEHAELSEQLTSLQKQRDALTTPVRAKLQAKLDKKQEGGPKPVDLKPIARWDFEGNADDQIGNLNGQIKGKAKIDGGALVLNGGMLATPSLPKTLGAKTLEVFVQLDHLDQKGGGAMTVQTNDGGVFDSVVFAERQKEVWMAGSDRFNRTEDFRGASQDGEADKRPVRIIIAYEKGGTIRGYRDGKPYGAPYKKTLQTYAPGNTQIVFGTRHGTNPSPGRALTGKIFEARLYDRALTAAEAAAASTGTMREVVTDQMVADALAAPQQKNLTELDGQISQLASQTAKLQNSLDEQNRKKQQAGDAYFRLAHAILNSKELIYVY